MNGTPKEPKLRRKWETPGLVTLAFRDTLGTPTTIFDFGSGALGSQTLFPSFPT
jgi:hypothetical protein